MAKDTIRRDIVTTTGHQCSPITTTADHGDNHIHHRGTGIMIVLNMETIRAIIINGVLTTLVRIILEAAHAPLATMNIIRRHRSNGSRNRPRKAKHQRHGLEIAKNIIHKALHLPSHNKRHQLTKDNRNIKHRRQRHEYSNKIHLSKQGTPLIMSLLIAGKLVKYKNRPAKLKKHNGMA